MLLWPKQAARKLLRFERDLEPAAVESIEVVAAIAPDGSRFVFHTRGPDGRHTLAVRRLDESKVTFLAGTEGADQAFFSPDGQWIGFFADGKLKRVPVQGGVPVELASSGISRGASWGDDGNIIAALDNGTGLSRIPANGGPPQAITHLLPGEITHRWPQVLPGSKAVLFTANSNTINSYEDSTIDVQSLATGERKTLWSGGYFGRYLPTSSLHGYLTFVRRGVLYAVPFDLVRLEIKGLPFPVLDDVAADPGSAAGYYDVSRDGILVYASGNGVRNWTVAWLDSAGQYTPATM